jgi:flagellar biosynthesis protein
MARKSTRHQDRAVALKYDEAKAAAPKVVAKGEGELARRIRDLAAENGIPLRRDDDLVELLAQIELDREIPPELYAAVAEILAWIYRANDALNQQSKK